MAAAGPFQGQAALVTGGGSGIGAALCSALAQAGAAVSVVDVDLAAAEAVAARICAAGGAAQALRCDVADAGAQRAAFAAHERRFGRLDVACLNAGVMELGSVVEGRGDWRRTLDVNLTAVAAGVGLAAAAMQRAGRGGSILVTASAGGVFPMPVAPAYAASKAGCVHLVRSLAEPLQRRGVRISALCPQFADTEMVRAVQRRSAAEAEAMMRGVGGGGRLLLTAAAVAEAGLALLADRGPQQGRVLVVLADGGWVEPAPVRFHASRLGGGRRGGAGAAPPPHPALAAWGAAVPRTHRRVAVHALSSDFAAATRVEEVPTPAPGAGQVLLRVVHSGVNASDINFITGRYFTGGGAAQQLPFGAGFEAVGVVAALGPGVTSLVVGQPVGTMTFGAFAEALVAPAASCFALPAPAPEFLQVSLTSGLTASVALEQAARLRAGQVALVTAAAGGTGVVAVQLAKAAGATVVATCGGAAKAALLRSLGVDRVVDHRTESLKEVLKAEYPRGVDVVYESVGGDMFDVCAAALAPRGRLVVIGAVSQYARQGGWQPSAHAGLAERLLARSAAVEGFFLPHYAREFRRHAGRLTAALEAGDLRALLDRERFVGVNDVGRAVARLLSGASSGKVTVQVARELPPAVAALAAAGGGGWARRPAPRL